MKRQLAVSKVAFLNREGSVWYRIKVHSKCTTKFRDMNDISQLLLVRMAWQMSPTFLSFTISLKVKRTLNFFAILFISCMLVSESQPSTSWAVVSLSSTMSVSYTHLYSSVLFLFLPQSSVYSRFKSCSDTCFPVYALPAALKLSLIHIQMCIRDRTRSLQ